MGEPIWTVRAVVAHEDYTLDILFADGLKKRFDMAGYLQYPVYEPLRHVPLFLQAHVEFDTVAWTEEIDIAPERLYEDGVVLPF